MSIFRNDTLGSWTRGGQAIVHNVRMTTQVFFQTVVAGVILWLMGAIWWALEHTTDYQRFVLVKLVEASFKTDAAPGTNDPVQFRTPAGKAYSTSADWLMASSLSKRTLHAFEVALIHGAIVADVLTLFALACAWFTFTRTGRGLGSNEYLRGARFGSARQVRRLLRRHGKGSFSIGAVPVPGSFEPEHILLCGAPGTGKTNLIVKMLDGIRKEGRRAIVYDAAGTFVEKFYRPERARPSYESLVALGRRSTRLSLRSDRGVDDPRQGGRSLLGEGCPRHARRGASQTRPGQGDAGVGPAGPTAAFQAEGAGCLCRRDRCRRVHQP